MHIFTFCVLFATGGGFSGMVGWTPSINNQWDRRVHSRGALGFKFCNNSFKSTSFSSIKCNSLPPPEANRNGRGSDDSKPYWGYKRFNV